MTTFAPVFAPGDFYAYKLSRYCAEEEEEEEEECKNCSKKCRLFGEHLKESDAKKQKAKRKNEIPTNVSLTLERETQERKEERKDDIRAPKTTYLCVRFNIIIIIIVVVIIIIIIIITKCAKGRHDVTACCEFSTVFSKPSRSRCTHPSVG